MVFPPLHTTLPHVTKDNWRDFAAQKKQATLDAIPKEWRFDASQFAQQKNVIDVPAKTGILSDKDLEITEIDDANQLAAKLADGTYSAVEVTTAYLKRAAVAHQLVNCGAIQKRSSKTNRLIVDLHSTNRLDRVLPGPSPRAG